MDGLTCHLCGEEMEPDVVLAQGDTCEQCYLFSAMPTATAQQFDDGFDRNIVAAAVESAEALDDLLG